MRILFVGMPDNIHAARWIDQIVDQGWEIYFFPTYLASPNQFFKKITFFYTSLLRAKKQDKTVRFVHWPSLFFLLNFLENRRSHKKTTRFKELALKFVIQILKPDIVHSLEFQLAGYLTLGAKERIKSNFPTWIATNWGSDIYLFSQLAEHQERIRQVLNNCDYYSCECERDVKLARNMGFQKKVLPVWPNAGGFHLEQIFPLRQSGLVSKRKIILLKGYQHWAGRALVAFQAFRLCKYALAGYTIVIYSASEEVKIAAQLFAREANLNIDIVSASSHEEILSLFGKARIYIGLSISDGISTSLLEAMAMGAFPIQSCTACANEWIECGSSGFIVPPEDPQEIADAISRAISDDPLVDQAAEINARTVKERLNYSIIQPEVVSMYEEILAHRKD